MRLLINLLLIVACVALASPQKDDDGDESKPYEFAFTIDGQQHRHEKKDTQGIIQGEFGFITADGIYHVTVYATDENGNFKILSMRNIRISAPLDGSPLPPGAKIESLPGISAPQPVQTPQPPPPPQVGYSVDNREIDRVSSPRPLPLSYQNQVNQQEISATTQRSNGPYAFTTQSTIKPACGGCGYVTTAKPINGKPTFQFQTPQFQDRANYPETGLLNNRPNPGAIPQTPPINSRVSISPENPSFKPLGGDNPENPTQPNQGFFNGPASPTQQNQGFFNSPVNPETPETNFETPKTSVEIIANPLSRPETPLSPTVNQPPSRLSQVSVSGGVIHVPGQDDIPIRDKFPGMVDGLPAGIQEKDITDLLYKFHYEVGFHGHYEKGTKSGAKIGGYFVNGRDGVSRIVTYVADENGFQPKFKFVRLGLDSPDTPKPDSEKTFGLKSFEFIWYPVD